MTTREKILGLRQRLSSSIIGQEDVIERLLVGLLANGNVLMEGFSGLGKTRAVMTLAMCIECEFSRIHCTPDLAHSDVTGAEIHERDEEGHGELHFHPGPIFGNLILADEINRSPAHVQSALLEAMEERQVTVGGKTHKLPELFMVVATQNPMELEGTHPLPDTQMDHFLMHIHIHQPGDEDELEILKLVRGEEAGPGAPQPPPIPQSVIFDARREVAAVRTSEAINLYFVDIISATRNPGRYGKDLARWIHVGASPRGTLALDRASRAYAWLQGRDHVTAEDVRAIAADCLRHRIIPSHEAGEEGMSRDDLLSALLQHIAIS